MRVRARGTHDTAAAEALLDQPLPLKRAMANLQELWLNRNQIGDDGMKALADVLKSPKGALASLQQLYLQNNNITDDGFETLMPLLKKGGKLSNLTGFGIGTHITDKGMTQFTEILAMGALASCARPFILAAILGATHP